MFKLDSLVAVLDAALRPALGKVEIAFMPHSVFLTLFLTERTGMDESLATAQLYEGLGIRLQRANARAILSRLAAASAAGHDNSALAATSRSEAALVLSSAASSGAG